MDAYNIEELMEARKLASLRRHKKYAKQYYAANSEKCCNLSKMYYHNNYEKYIKNRNETEERRKAVKKWKLENQEKKQQYSGSLQG